MNGIVGVGNCERQGGGQRVGIVAAVGLQISRCQTLGAAARAMEGLVAGQLLGNRAQPAPGITALL